MFSLAMSSNWIKSGKVSRLSLILAAALFTVPLILLPSEAAAQNTLQLEEGIFSPGDSVVVTIDKVESLSKNYDIDDQGFADFLYLGKINVNGLSTDQVSQQLIDLYGRNYLNNPKINVALIPKDNSAAPVSDSPDDTSDLLFSFTVSESPDAEPTLIPLTEESTSPAATNSLPERRIILSGQVASPGIYSLTENQPIGVALQRAGGLNSDADIDQIIVFRSDIGGKRNAYIVDYSSVLSGKIIDPIIIAGDYIFIKSTEDDFEWDALQQIISIIDLPLNIALNSRN